MPVSHGDVCHVWVCQTQQFFLGDVSYTSEDDFVIHDIDAIPFP